MTKHRNKPLLEELTEQPDDGRRYRKAVIEKGVFTDAEFRAKLDTEKANYPAVLKRLH